MIIRFSILTLVGITAYLFIRELNRPRMSKAVRDELARVAPLSILTDAQAQRLRMRS